MSTGRMLLLRGSKRVNLGGGRGPSRQVLQSLVLGATRTRAASSSTTTYPEGWAAAAEKELKGKEPLDSLLFHTPEEIIIKPVYGAHDLEGLEIDQSK